MNLLRDIFNAHQNYKYGVIEFEPLGYIYSDKGWTSRGGFFFKPYENIEGKVVSLVERKTVKNCWLDSMEGAYPKMDFGYSVPYSVCRKCEHYMKTDRKHKRPRCAYLIEKRKDLPSALESTLNALDSAVSEANKMLGGK